MLLLASRIIIMQLHELEQYLDDLHEHTMEKEIQS